MPGSTCAPWAGADHQPVVMHRFELRCRLHDGQPHDASAVLRLALDGVPPPAVLRLSVRRGSDVVYEVSSVRDARGGLLAAGQLVAAMAAMSGDDGLVVPTARLQLTLASVVVEVLAHLDGNGAPHPARLRATLRQD